MKIFKSVLVMSVLLTMLVACGDDSSSSVSPEPAGDSSSSVNQSSSSITDKGTSSGVSSKSSSSVKPDSNGSQKNSSSAITVQSSSSSNVKSSSSKAWTCKEEGKSVTRYNEATGLIDVYLCTNGVYELVVYSSSSEKVYTFKELFKEDSVFNKNMEYGTFVDSRDGQEYKTIEVYFNHGDVEYFTAFAQNLNYGTQIKLRTATFDDDKVEKFCYDDDPWYCEHYFGGLYSWSEAMGLPKACDSVWTGTTSTCPDSIASGMENRYDWMELQHQGICPEGWHVMNEREWRNMIRGEESAGAVMSKAANGSNGTGFSALFCGGISDTEGYEYRYIGDLSHFWFPHEVSNTSANYMYLSKNQYGYDYNYYKFIGKSVRCVKNYLSESK